MVYGLTAADLGLAQVGSGYGSRAGNATKKGASVEASRNPGAGKGKVPIKYRDDAGNTWTGRGSRPRWLTTALAAGRSLDSFSVAGPDAGRGNASGNGRRSSSKAKRRVSAPKYKDDFGNT